MPKNIVILCDGTSNEVSENRTNVLRLYGALEKSPYQIVFYDPGVGTFGAENSWSKVYRKFLEVLGLATGWGLDQNVKETYKFLVENYDDGKRPDGIDDEEPDQIYIFGFSRGAYTARVLAGFIHAVGLVDQINLNLLKYAYRAYKGITRDPHQQHDFAHTERDSAFAEVRLYQRMLKPKRPKIRCLGLFDTVSSMIEIGRFGIRLRSHAFTRINPSVEFVRHAVGIDERRSLFQPQLWPKGNEWKIPESDGELGGAQDVREVWFTGFHCDIGGGYPEEKSALAKITLDWMIAETAPLGLEYASDTVDKIVRAIGDDPNYVAPNPLAMPTNSMKPLWRIVELAPRRVSKYLPPPRPALFGWYIPFFSPRVIPEGAEIHSSVFERRGTPSDIDQPNIPTEHVIYVPDLPDGS